MFRIAILFVLVAVPAFAQIPTGLPSFADPPEANGASFTAYPRHILWNSGQACMQRSTATSWQCLSTAAQTEAAKSAAISQAATDAAATYMPTATANAALAAVNARVDGVQATAGGAATQAALDAAVASLSASLAGVQSSVTTLGMRVTATESAASALASRVGSLETGSATTAALTSEVATLNARIDAVQASIIADSVCTNTTVSSAIVVPVLGLSTITTTTLPGVIAGAPCTVGSTVFQPLGGTARCIASGTNQIQLRFEGALLTFPAGVYRQCVQVRP